MNTDIFIQSKGSVPFWIQGPLATMGLNPTVSNLQDNKRVALPNELLLQSLSFDYLHLKMSYIIQVGECVSKGLINIVSIHIKY